MAYGHKTGGRTAGTPNKLTSDVRSRIAALIDEQFDTISSDLDALEPKERVTAYLKFLEYVLPKQREQLNTGPELFTKVTTDAEGNTITEHLPYSIPFEIIDPVTREVFSMDIGADEPIIDFDVDE
ncbi:MAG: hypothetical protein H7319_13740 [Spirosoma sp.]|nr:hypothetical protein [Spirosoma sp.]